MLDSDRFVVESPYVRRARRSQWRHRLICFPYAGAGAAGFADWPQWLPADVELIAVQLPGREDRIREKPLTTMSALVRTVALALRPYLQGQFAFFGHSVGAVMAYELARALRDKRGVQPAHLLLSGHVAPDHPVSLKRLHDLPEPEFREALRELGGTAGSVVDDENLMGLLLPALRADFTLGETYRYAPGEPLSAPITVFGGDRDERAPLDGLAAWRRHTTGPFAEHVFAGGHFYLNESGAELAEAIGSALGQQTLRQEVRIP
ncbi:thioesterase II family protein [Kutzneria albida]|uniref:Thioesterase TesA-like domain-containing protein n=1 Tax=Kutzneria albida DSM 43870 TaxID=1449976 RepID=W5WE98_9PSEU|nr:alpha/beta fold hydrolase [Kutzneria albida]AHH99513.1 hypothetical protein KALB_6153 [Kutzneria albida DSM 43870]